MRVLETTGPATVGQLAWVRHSNLEIDGWEAAAGELPSLPARQNRSIYNSLRRSLDQLVDRGVLAKRADPEGQIRYQLSPARHGYKAMALASLAQAKLGPEHYRRLVDADSTAETVLGAICAATGWTPQKVKTAIESIAQVLKG